MRRRGARPRSNGGCAPAPTACRRQLDPWPPNRGKVHPGAWPAVVALVREAADGERAVLAAVLGPLEPPRRLYGEEEYE